MRPRAHRTSFRSGVSYANHAGGGVGFPVGGLRVVVFLAIGADIEIDEAAPIDRTARRHGLEAGERVLEIPVREDRQQHAVVIVQPIAGPDHGVAEPVTGDRKFDRHKRPGFPVKVFEHQLDHNDPRSGFQ